MNGSDGRGGAVMASAGGATAERDRVERFLGAFNAVDRLLRERTGIGDHGASFRTVLRRFLRTQGWRGAERLEEYADLRNLLVHETLAPDAWLAVPTEEVVRRIEAIRDRLAGARRADEAFRRRVEALDRATPLADALRLAHRTGYSQIPLTSAGRLVGLLTDRGLARWWAARAAEPNADLDAALRAASAGDVLATDADRVTWALAAGDEDAVRVLARFVDTPTLEAVVITDDGRADGELVGIATHLDVVRFWDGG
jgi:CBS domain-containing protein